MSCSHETLKRVRTTKHDCLLIAYLAFIKRFRAREGGQRSPPPLVPNGESLCAHVRARILARHYSDRILYIIDHFFSHCLGGASNIPLSISRAKADNRKICTSKAICTSSQFLSSLCTLYVCTTVALVHWYISSYASWMGYLSLLLIALYLYAVSDYNLRNTRACTLLRMSHILAAAYSWQQIV